MEIGIVGSGAWGCALACAVARAGHVPLLWGRDPGLLRTIAERRENPRQLPGVPLAPQIRVVPDALELAAASVWLLAVPAQALRAVLRVLPPARAVCVICAKGIERGSGLLLSQVVEEVRPGTPLAVLSGPSFAAEVARGLPTALTLAAPRIEDARGLAGRLASPAFRLYASDDVVGVELVGALKNVVAIAAGAVMGMGLGENARAALITRGLAETARLVAAEGGRRETLMGLAGLGDLLLTATSLTSRNTRFGYELGRGARPRDLLAPDRPLAEGAWTARAAVERAARHGIELPITAAVADVVEGVVDVREAVRRLLSRPLPPRE